MKYIGMILMIIAGIYSSLIYKEKRERRLLECEELCAFFEFIYSGISSYLYTYKEMAEKFECKALLEAGFIASLRENGDIYTSFKCSHDALSLPEFEKERLCDMFSSLGTGELDNEKNKISECREYLFSLAEKERKSTARDIKLFSVILLGALLGLIIILV